MIQMKNGAMYHRSRERASLRANPDGIRGILHIRAGEVRPLGGEETGAHAEVAVWTFNNEEIR